MKTIYKYRLPLREVVKIQMPTDSDILSIMSQGNDICIWAEVNTENLMTTRTFGVFGTGHEIPTKYELDYVGSVSLLEGSLILHVYEYLL